MNHAFAAGRLISRETEVTNRCVEQEEQTPLPTFMWSLPALPYAQLTGAGVNAFSVVKPTELQYNLYWCCVVGFVCLFFCLWQGLTV